MLRIRLKWRITRGAAPVILHFRRKEKQLDNLSNEIENMVTKVHESVQPFYRTRAKVLATKKISDKNHDGVKNILVLNK